MKRLIAASVASMMFAGTAAEAAYFHPGPRHFAGPVFAGPRPNVWMRGGYYRPAFGRPVIVNDWRFLNLRRPPLGYHWVRAGDRFLMVALATGLIADVAFANGYGPYNAFNAYGY